VPWLSLSWCSLADSSQPVGPATAGLSLWPKREAARRLSRGGPLEDCRAVREGSGCDRILANPDRRGCGIYGLSSLARRGFFLRIANQPIHGSSISSVENAEEHSASVNPLGPAPAGPFFPGAVPQMPPTNLPRANYVLLVDPVRAHAHGDPISQPCLSHCTSRGRCSKGHHGCRWKDATLFRCAGLL